jgi:hypothetical protein
VTIDKTGMIFCRVWLTLKRSPSPMFPGGVVREWYDFWEEAANFCLSKHDVVVFTMLAGHDTPTRDDVHNALWGTPRRRSRIFPLTAAQRASTSRTLRRLRNLGLLDRDRRRLKLTRQGAAVAGSILLAWSGWRRYKRNFLSKR